MQTCRSNRNADDRAAIESDRDPNIPLRPRQSRGPDCPCLTSHNMFVGPALRRKASLKTEVIATAPFRLKAGLRAPQVAQPADNSVNESLQVLSRSERHPIVYFVYDPAEIGV